MHVSYFTGPANGPSAVSRGWRSYEQALPGDRDIDVRVIDVVCSCDVGSDRREPGVTMVTTGAVGTPQAAAKKWLAAH